MTLSLTCILFATSCGYAPPIYKLSNCKDYYGVLNGDILTTCDMAGHNRRLRCTANPLKIKCDLIREHHIYQDSELICHRYYSSRSEGLCEDLEYYNNY